MLLIDDEVAVLEGIVQYIFALTDVNGADSSAIVFVVDHEFFLVAQEESIRVHVRGDDFAIGIGIFGIIFGTLVG